MCIANDAVRSLKVTHISACHIPWHAGLESARHHLIVLLQNLHAQPARSSLPQVLQPGDGHRMLVDFAGVAGVNQDIGVNEVR